VLQCVAVYISVHIVGHKFVAVWCSVYIRVSLRVVGHLHVYHCMSVSVSVRECVCVCV